MPLARPTVVALTKKNSNAAELLTFLHKLVSVRSPSPVCVEGLPQYAVTTDHKILVQQVLTEYFKELEEESIRDNFVIIYELLDEMMDFGYPQTTESKILQECVSLLCTFRSRQLVRELNEDKQS